MIMKSTIKKIFGYSVLMMASALVAGVTTYALVEKNASKQTIVAVQEPTGFAMPTALFENKTAQPVDLT